MGQGIPNGKDPLFEDKFARVYAEIVRIDQLRQTDAISAVRLAEERDRRLDQRMDAQETAVEAALTAAKEAVSAALTSSEKAVDKAEIAQKVVNASQNEFRGTLRDQAGLFIPRLEAENTFRELRGLIGSQATTITDLRSRLDVGPPSLGVLQARSDQDVGRSSQSASSRALLFAVAASAVGVLGLVLAAMSLFR